MLRFACPIVGLVVGHFGEWSDGLYRLVGAAADDAAPRMRAMWGARTDEDSRNRCSAYLRREIAWAGLNTNARLKLERAELVGWDARSVAARRAKRAVAARAGQYDDELLETAVRDRRRERTGGADRGTDAMIGFARASHRARHECARTAIDRWGTIVKMGG